MVLVDSVTYSQCMVVVTMFLNKIIPPIGKLKSVQS